MNWASKRILVTGGAGFLGSHMIQHLAGIGCRDVFVVRSREFDLTKEDDVDRLFRQHPSDIVVHLAGLVGGIGANKAYPGQFFYNNLMMGALTMHYAWKSGVEKFVCAGAGCGYPEFAPTPLSEESFWNGFPQTDSAPYSLAKRMLIVQSMAYWRQYKFPAIVAIPGNIYGPCDNFDLENAHVIPALVRKFVEGARRKDDQIVVWGSGRPTRDFVYAGDVATGMIRAAEVYNDSTLVNLSSGKEHSIREVVDLLVELTGFQGKVIWDASRPDGQIRRRFDISKARRELGYEPVTDLREGLRKTVEWYAANWDQARNDVAVPILV